MVYNTPMKKLARKPSPAHGKLQEENSLNGVLADVLAGEEYGFDTQAETSAPGSRKRCDVQVRLKHGDFFYTAIECKKGQDKQQKKKAAHDLKRWWKDDDCWNAIALCYPESLAEASEQQRSVQFRKSRDLCFAKVDKKGEIIANWQTGPLLDLANLIKEVDSPDTEIITETIQKAILAASAHLSQQTGKELAEKLQIAWEPENGRNDQRPARIACLILTNMCLLHDRLQGEKIVLGLTPLFKVEKVSDKQQALLADWQMIREKDYAPVVDPALLVLNVLPPDTSTEGCLSRLLEAVRSCAKRIRGLQLDHAGPIYHQLLQTAHYDGSFYTSAPAAALLAGLAFPKDRPPVGNWADIELLRKLKVCDPACGTGTLLMAIANTIEQRYKDAVGAGQGSCDMLHLMLVEDVLHGMDINRHAIHLAACMLTLAAPKIDYNRMRLYNMLHGVMDNGDVRAGSLDILLDGAPFLRPVAPAPKVEFRPPVAPDSKQHRASAEGFKIEEIGLNKSCDLIIMNPPFTRNDIRNRSLPNKQRKLVQQHEGQIAEKTPDPVHREAIHQSTLDSFFTPIADQLLNPSGTLAIINPFTVCTGAAAKGKRRLLTTPERFQLEIVVTSHDNRRIYFSENTDIHESLFIARRPAPGSAPKETAFVSLAENPATPTAARQLAAAIREALVQNDATGLSDYGNITFRSHEQLKDGQPWNAACFYDQSLAEGADWMAAHSALRPIGEQAQVGPDGRSARGAFVHAKHPQNPNVRALWKHNSDRQVTMRTTPDCYLVSKKKKGRAALNLWKKRGHLLLANRLWLKLTSTPAVFSDNPIIGSAFITVTLAEREKRQSLRLCKAWCVWFNSTFGVLAFLNARQRKLTYPRFSVNGLRDLPAPDPKKCDIRLLAAAFDEYADQTLRPLPQLNDDPVRLALDQAVVEALPGKTGKKAAANKASAWRRLIPSEPSVHNEKAAKA